MSTSIPTPPHSASVAVPVAQIEDLALFLRDKCGLGYNGPVTLTVREANDLRDGLAIIVSKARSALQRL